MNKNHFQETYSSKPPSFLVSVFFFFFVLSGERSVSIELQKVMKNDVENEKEQKTYTSKPN